MSDSYAVTKRCSGRNLQNPPSGWRSKPEFVSGGRHWTRTSDLLHVKHFRLSAVLGTWEAEQNRRSYAVTVMPDRDASKELPRFL